MHNFEGIHDDHNAEELTTPAGFVMQCPHGHLHIMKLPPNAQFNTEHILAQRDPITQLRDEIKRHGALKEINISMSMMLDLVTVAADLAGAFEEIELPFIVGGGKARIYHV